MSTDPTCATRTVVADKIGGVRVVSEDEMRNQPGVIAPAIDRNMNADLDRYVDRGAVVEIPGTRRGRWEYRVTALAVDVWEVHAYVGELVGEAAVRASDEFIAALAWAARHGTRPAVQYDSTWQIRVDS